MNSPLSSEQCDSKNLIQIYLIFPFQFNQTGWENFCITYIFVNIFSRFKILELGSSWPTDPFDQFVVANLCKIFFICWIKMLNANYILFIISFPLRRNVFCVTDYIPYNPSSVYLVTFILIFLQIHHKLPRYASCLTLRMRAVSTEWVLPTKH